MRDRRVHAVPEAGLTPPPRLGGRPVTAAFLDRDGTLNVKAPPGRYITSPDRLELLAGAADAVAALNRAGVVTVLVTNQRWLARPGSDPGSDPDGYPAVHRRLVELLAAAGARLDATYHCPHDLDSCACRKPRPGMLLAAARDLGLDLRRAVMIGDADSDVEAGLRAGTATIRIGGAGSRPHAVPDAVVPDLRAAARLLLSTSTER